MCGIIAARGPDAGQLTLDGLRELEYRGYDSAGIVVLGDGEHLVAERAVGKLDVLLTQVGDDRSILRPVGELAIGHTRWATHGEVSARNTHPLFDCYGHVAVVHNGVLDNAVSLREELILTGHRFGSDVDSEVIAHLVERGLDNGATPLEAVRKAVGLLEGSWAVALIVEGFDAIYLARQGSPLLVRGAVDRFLVASDPRATLGVPGPLRVLDDGDVVELGRRRWRWTGAGGDEGLPPVLEDTTGRAVELSARVLDAGQTDMAVEIADQSRHVGELVERALAEQMRHGAWQQLGVPLPQRVLLLGCGTSYHAAQVIARALRTVAGVPADVMIASEYDPRVADTDAIDLVVAISQSGETADLLGALDQVHRPVVAITNSVWSSLARRAEVVLDCGAGEERGVAATKSFTAQVVQGIGLALAAATAAGRSSCAQAARRELLNLPGELERTDRASAPAAAELAGQLLDATGWLFLGTGSGLPYAAEGALKLKEITYRWAQSYPAAELKHGPLALVESGTPVVVVDNAVPRLAIAVSEVRSRGARVITVGGPHSDLGPDRVGDDPPWGPLACIPALQHLALALGTGLGRDVDRPRNLAKSVTVA